MVKNLAALGLIITFCACTGSTDRVQLKTLNDCLERSNSFIENSGIQVRNEMDNKLADPYSHASALAWFTPAASLRQSSSDLKKYIDSLKSILNKGQEFDREGKQILFRKLIACKQLLPAVFDTLIRDKPLVKKDIIGLNEQLPLLHGYPSQMDKDQLISYGRNWIDSNFSSTNPLMTLASLNIIKNDLCIWANQWLKYCNMHVRNNSDDFDETGFVIGINSSYVKTGQSIEVSAGVGYFNSRCNPRITVNGVPVNIGPEGMAVYETKATGNKGKHPIRVTIEYTRPDGTRDKVFKTLEYTVAE